MSVDLTYYRAAFYLEGARRPWRTEMACSVGELLTALDDECARHHNEGLWKDVRSVDIERDTEQEATHLWLLFCGPWEKPRALLREIKKEVLK